MFSRYTKHYLKKDIEEDGDNYKELKAILVETKLSKKAIDEVIMTCKDGGGCGFSGANYCASYLLASHIKTLFNMKFQDFRFGFTSKHIEPENGPGDQIF